MATLYVHVGMATCASTTLHDTLLRQPVKDVRATGFGALTPLVDYAMARASSGRTTAVSPLRPADAERQFARWRKKMREHAASGGPGNRVAFTNECVTGVYPRHIRSAEAPWFSPEVIRDFRLEAAEALLAVAPQARVLILVRDPRAWLRSMVNNLVAMGLVTDTTEFRARHLPVLTAWYAMDEILPLYRALFGDRNVTILPIELARADPQHFQAALADHYGFALRWSGPPRNQSLPGGALTGLRSLYAVVDDLSPATGSWTDPNTRLKSAMGRFLLEAVRNEPAALKNLHERYGDTDGADVVDEHALDAMWVSNQCLAPLFAEWGLPDTRPAP